MNLLEIINKYKENGYNEVDSIAKTCQDIILLKISKSSLYNNVTIKGGVVMHGISKDKRRATRDIDLDFIKYSLEDESIYKFIDNLNAQNSDGINLEITSIQKLHHQDYDGKRVLVKLTDNTGFSTTSKLDIGVHKLFDINQDEYCFELNAIKASATLLINSKEQIFSEKLKSLLRFGLTSTRQKDIFDFYYLINYTKLDHNELVKCFDILIFKDGKLSQNNINDIYNRLYFIFNNNRYRNRLNYANNNWLNIDTDEVINNILEFIKSLDVVQV